MINSTTIKCARSFFLFNKSNILRKFFTKIVLHKNFDRYIIYIIVISSLILILDTYNSEIDSPLFTLIIHIMNYIITIIFILEAMIKSISLGFCLDEHSYLRDGWSVLDFLIVIS